MKKIIACALALILLVGAIIFNLPSPVNIVAPVPVVAAPIPREGYLLVPTIQGITGVDTTSAFTLTSPYDNADTPAIIIDGQPEPNITRISDNEFLIIPSATLSPNSLYLFRLNRAGLTDITWTFQTTIRFEITSTLPGNQSTNVPVDTGIEITFTTTGHTGIADYFSIYPYVPGRFISRGATAIFMPTSPLAHRQLYTVTIRAGIGLPGTNEIIATDHIFSFETESSTNQQDGVSRDTFRFFNRYVEFPSFEPARLSYRLNSDSWTAWPALNNRDEQRPTINIRVYPLNGREHAAQAFNQLVNAPWWAIFAWQNNIIDTAGLTPIMAFDITERQGQDDWFETIELPDTLPPGFYLISATVDDFTDQVMLQITDLAVQVIADNDRALLWVNDMTTGQPAVGAQINDRISNANYTVNESGIAFVERTLNQDEAATITITAANGKEISLFFSGGGHHGGGWWWGPTVDQDYWTVLQLDRNLFQRSDTLYFWGFVQNRQGSQDIRNVTATITQSWGWHMDTQDVLHRQTVPVSQGVYSGEIRLPHLDPGSYNLTINYGNTIIGSTFFSVEDYVTPSYQMLVSADRQAVFAGETVNFTVRSQFFEGTPVSGLGINYNLWGSWGIRDIPGGRGVTSQDGEFTISAVPHPTDGTIQGRVGVSLGADATLPEVGFVQRHASVDVFINDIEVQAQASRDGADATISVNVHNITLDRINNGTAAYWGDFLCDPVAGQVLNVEIYRVYWVATRFGEFYCHIERRVIPRYRHNRREEVIERFQLTTDENGEAARDFTVPNREYESYHARVTATDGNGRTITHNLFIGRDWSNFMWRTESGEPFLYSGLDWGDTIDIGDEVELAVMRGTETLSHGSFLFVVMQNGILHYQVGTQNPFTFTFAEKHVPNAVVYAYLFNGHTYHGGWQMNQRLNFNSESRQLQISVTANQEAYRPGDTSSLTITVTDMDGNPKAANINISVVDEALFALRNSFVDTLRDLYSGVGDGRLFSLSTHRTFASDGIDDSFGGLWGQTSADMAVAPAAEVAAEADSFGGGDTHLRENFMDTAIFASQRTNMQGAAEFSFQLPDNITSWRVTVSAISDDLYAGNTVENIIVTNPMFLHYALGSTFLVGDTPTIGINAYGTSLTGNETINFEVWDENNPELIRRSSGTAFERVNIPLWEMAEEGTHALIIRATVEGSPQLSDAVRHQYRVVHTHRLVDTTVFYDVTADTIFDVGVQGLTNITFTDHGRGQFLRDLLNMRHIRGARLEGLTARREADKLIAANFPDVDLWHWDNQPFDPRDYQRPDGGLAIFPYADSDLATTVMLIPFLAEDINLQALRNYLYSVYESDNAANKMLALYGLALLQSPVLLDLQNYARLTDLSVRDTAFIALGLAALGETYVAASMYRERILPHLQSVEPWYRVNTNLGRDSVLEATSTVALLAAKLNMPERLGLHQYAARLRTCDLLITIERLTFIAHEIEHHEAAAASITYTLFGEEFTRELTWGYTLRIPAQNMHQFELTHVIGDVSAVSVHHVPLEDVDIIDNDIVISRTFLREGGQVATGAFQQDERIRVQITIDYSAKAIDGSYLVTDFLPAGLTFVEGSARFQSPRTGNFHWTHAVADGQRVMFFDYNGRFDGVRVYYYYARVISPGIFTAEGAIVQNLGARAYLTVGLDDAVVVE